MFWRRADGRLWQWWHYWYGFMARLDAIWHLMRGHDLEWRTEPDEDEIDGIKWRCSGDIVCRRCPDGDEPGNDLAIWCRSNP